MVGSIGFQHKKLSNSEEDISESNGIRIELNINKIKDMASLDIDLRKIDAKREEIEKITDKFIFMRNIEIPKDFHGNTGVLIFSPYGLFK